MADFTSFTGKFRAHKNGSHESPGGKVVKRPRLACNHCQKAKVRCDRNQPCSSCVKKGEVTTCVYQRSRGPSTDVSRNALAEDRLVHLESMVKQLMENQISVPAGNNAASTRLIAPSNKPDGVVEAGDEYRGEHVEDSGYVGSTHWSAVLNDIHELKFVLGNSADLRDEDTRIISAPPVIAGELIFGSPKTYSLHHIISQYLPSKIEIDRFLSVYFQNETYIVPFIHTYNFQRQYREFWKDPTSVNPLWMSILFSICYMGSLIRRRTDSRHSSQNDLYSGQSAFHTAAGQCLILGEYTLLTEICRRSPCSLWLLQKSEQP